LAVLAKWRGSWMICGLWIWTKTNGECFRWVLAIWKEVPQDKRQSTWVRIQKRFKNKSRSSIWRLNHQAKADTLNLKCFPLNSPWSRPHLFNNFPHYSVASLIKFKYTRIRRKTTKKIYP
jgi:hypothetical protein